MATILLIDDSPTIRTIIKIYLMGGSFDFLEAEDGKRGLEIARLVPVSLVIADIVMPGMDGLAFVKALRHDEKEQVRSLPVILLTGEKSEDTKTQGLEAGANAYIQKPVSSARLLEVVDKFLPARSP